MATQAPARTATQPHPAHRWAALLRVIFISGMACPTATHAQADAQTMLYVEAPAAATSVRPPGPGVDVHLRRLRSRKVIEPVIRRLARAGQLDRIDVAATPDPSRDPAVLRAAIERVGARLSTERVENTQLIRLTARARRPAQARRLADEIAAAYLTLIRDEQLAATRAAIRSLEERRTQLEQRIKTTRAAHPTDPNIARHEAMLVKLRLRLAEARLHAMTTRPSVRVVDTTRLKRRSAP